jgi:hypothetical protein
MIVKKIKTKDGYQEITTTTITFTKVSDKPMMTADESWRRISKQIRRGGYTCCCRCKKRFDMNEPFHLAMSNDGNKWICRKCKDEVEVDSCQS